MTQKHEIIIAICIEDDHINPIDADQLANDLSKELENNHGLLSARKLLYVENLEEEWGEPV